MNERATEIYNEMVDVASKYTGDRMRGLRSMQIHGALQAAAVQIDDLETRLAEFREPTKRDRRVRRLYATDSRRVRTQRSLVKLAPARAKPILKWAGGKRRLIPMIAPAILNTISNTGGYYFEPFVGGGALAFHLGLGPMAVISDWNEELMACYRAIQTDVGRVCWTLSGLAVNGLDKETFQSIRAWAPTCMYQRAARMVYLNRLGFNGLYRVNKANKFNAPYAEWRPSILGRSSRDAITSLFPNREKFQDAADAIQGTIVMSGDFGRVILRARHGDLVYCDPPYDGTYDGYTPGGFSNNDQKRLALYLEAAHKRGATIMVSNSDTERVRGLYQWADEIVMTEESRTINSDTKGRIKAQCVLIVAKGAR